MTKLTYWKIGPTQELPNQLVLQTGHRNAGAKTAPWTPNATKCCKWTCCSDLPIWQALYQPGMVLLPRWTTEPKDSPNQPPTIIYKTAAKEIDRPRSQDNTPGRQFGPQVKQCMRRTLPNKGSEVSKPFWIRLGHFRTKVRKCTKNYDCCWDTSE